MNGQNADTLTAAIQIFQEQLKNNPPAVLEATRLREYDALGRAAADLAVAEFNTSNGDGRHWFCSSAAYPGVHQFSLHALTLPSSSAVWISYSRCLKLVLRDCSACTHRYHELRSNLTELYRSLQIQEKMVSKAMSLFRTYDLGRVREAVEQVAAGENMPDSIVYEISFWCLVDNTIINILSKSQIVMETLSRSSLQLRPDLAATPIDMVFAFFKSGFSMKRLQNYLEDPKINDQSLGLHMTTALVLILNYFSKAEMDDAGLLLLGKCYKLVTKQEKQELSSLMLDCISQCSEWGLGALECLNELSKAPGWDIDPHPLLNAFTSLAERPCLLLDHYETDQVRFVTDLVGSLNLRILKNRYDDSETQSSLYRLCSRLVQIVNPITDVVASQLIMGGLYMRKSFNSGSLPVSEDMLKVRKPLAMLASPELNFTQRVLSSHSITVMMKFDYFSCSLAYFVLKALDSVKHKRDTSNTDVHNIVAILNTNLKACTEAGILTAILDGCQYVWILFHLKNIISVPMYTTQDSNIMSWHSINWDELKECLQSALFTIANQKASLKAPTEKPSFASLFLLMSSLSPLAQPAINAVLASVNATSFTQAMKAYQTNDLVLLARSLRETATQLVYYGNLDACLNYLLLISQDCPFILSDKAILERLDARSLDVVETLIKCSWYLTRSCQENCFKTMKTYPEITAAVKRLYPAVDVLLDWTREYIAVMPSKKTQVSGGIQDLLVAIIPRLSLSDEFLRSLVVVKSRGLINTLYGLRIELSEEARTLLLDICNGKSAKILTDEEISGLFQNCEGLYPYPTADMVLRRRNLLDAEKRRIDAPVMGLQSLISPPSATLTQTSTAAQKSLLSFFSPLGKDAKPRIDPPRITSAGITPSTAPQKSMMLQIREDLHAKAHLHSSKVKSLTGSITRPQTITSGPAPKIHPPRPPGFNHKDKAKSVSKTQPAPPASESSSDSESDDGDTNSHNGALSTLGKRKTEVIDSVSGSRRYGPVRPMPSNTQNQEEMRKAKRRKLRLSLDCTSLHKEILEWQYFDESAFPSNFLEKVKPVPGTFASATNYVEVMKPLLLLEAWEGLQKAKMENDLRPILLQLGTREVVDDFLDVHVMASRGDFASQKFTENDIVLLVFNGDKNPKEPCKISSEYVSCIAKITDGLNSHSGTKSRDSRDFKIRVSRDSALVPHLLPQRSITAMKIMTLTTMEREYSALMAIDHYDLLNQILSAEPAKITEPNPGQCLRYEKAWGLNASQARAVHQAVTARGFSLIQGPPGTGKTKTILSIVGATFEAKTNPRILICAPSNAAVDEILVRLKPGIKSTGGQTLQPKLLRLGRSEAMSDDVKGLVLEEVIERQLDDIAANVDQGLYKLVSSLKVQLKQVESSVPDSPEEIMATEKKREFLLSELKQNQRLLYSQKEKLDTEKKRRDVQYHTKVNEALSASNVICSTLSGSAFAPLAALDLRFDCIIIDEAAQAVELSTLIPLRHSCDRIVLVGDPHQLPPTVLSKEAARLKYEQSLFVRMFDRYKDRVAMLNVQFRMHPDIARFPSKVFYDDKLENGPNMREITSRPWHRNRLFPPFRFFDCAGYQTNASKSFSNRDECHVVCELIYRLTKEFRDMSFKGKIGVISPYKAQVHLLRDTLRKHLGSRIFESVDIGSVDGFQGREKDIIIFTAVRVSGGQGGLGFITDVRRMNVSLTRAKSSLWVVGHVDSLVRNPQWKKLIETAKSERGWFSSANETSSLVNDRRRR